MILRSCYVCHEGHRVQGHSAGWGDLHRRTGRLRRLCPATLHRPPPAEKNEKNNLYRYLDLSDLFIYYGFPLSNRTKYHII